LLVGLVAGYVRNLEGVRQDKGLVDNIKND